MNSLGRLHRVVVLAVVGCALPWAGQMLGAGQVFGQRSGDSELDAKRLSRNRVSEAPRGLKPAAQDIQDIQDIMGIDSTATDRSAAVRSAVARAVTGPTENLSDIIAGEVPATLIFALTPVAEHPDGAYGGGNLSYSSADISGQELTVNAGTTTYWNVQLSNWAPTGLRMRFMQAKVLASSFDSGDGASLIYPSIPCASTADCESTLHGEKGSKCISGFCTPWWINRTRTDWLFFDLIETDCVAAWCLDCYSPTGPLFFAVANPNPSDTEFCSVADEGIIYYVGTLALTVPLGAVGTYTIEFLDVETSALDDTLSPFPIEIPIGTLASGVLHVLPPADPWTPDTCTVEPEEVTNLDQATITLGGDWGTDCVPRVSQITIDGNTVYFDVLLDYGPDPICPTVITPWTLSETLDPPLTPGTYTIMVTLFGSSSIAPVPTPFCNFTVVQGAWPPKSCKVEPVDVTSSDEATITLGGDWPNSCVPNVAQITTDWITVDFDVVVDYPAGTDCPAVITPWSLSATLDPLTPDTYTVMATLYGVPSIPSVPTFVCSFTVKPANPIAQNRYIAMEVPATESEQTAIEVTLAMLHHTCGPGSWNVLDPCLSDAYCRGGVCETPFAGFEGQKRYVNAIRMCRGGTEDGRGICKSQDDCDERGKGGTCEQMYTCQGGTEPGGKACIDQAACDARMDFRTGVPRGGTCLPSITCEDSETLETTFACAVLGCQPEYRDWASELGGRTLYATGPEIMPGASRYEITLVPASCMGNEGSCAETLPLLTVGTPRWGDVEDHVGVSTFDLVHMVDRIKELVGTILKPAAQFQPQQVNPLNPMDVRDLTLAVDALKSFPYPYKTLTPCE